MRKKSGIKLERRASEWAAMFRFEQEESGWYMTESCFCPKCKKITDIKHSIWICGNDDEMQALVDGESHEEATKLLIEPHKNAEKLQKDFIKAWKSKKVPVSFKDVD